VLLDSSDGRETWGSVGVSDNVVEASWQALVDSIVFGLLRFQEEDEGPLEGMPGVRRLRTSSLPSSPYFCA